MEFMTVTKSGIIIESINEDTVACYFTDGKNAYGVNKELLFFVNHQWIDLKLKQKFIGFFQYKSVSHNLMFDNDNITYNVGVETEDNSYRYKYTMSINTGVKIKAEKFDQDKLIDTRTMVVK